MSSEVIQRSGSLHFASLIHESEPSLIWMYINTSLLGRFVGIPSTLRSLHIHSFHGGWHPLKNVAQIKSMSYIAQRFTFAE